MQGHAGARLSVPRLRFAAPARAGLDPGLLRQPIFDALDADRDWLEGADWPDLPAMNLRLQGVRHALTGLPIRLVEPALDARHYEQRIWDEGAVATRSRNWHDLFNALAWKNFPATKSALNAIQVRDLREAGPGSRTRRQAALTQFDEAGAIVVLRDDRLLASWDRHDWAGLFLQRREAWLDGSIVLHVFGHALFEHALNPDLLLVAKCVPLVVAEPGSAIADRAVAAMIVSGQCLGDPQDLRPLPLAGLPGWHRDRQDPDFYETKPCFRPLRPGRRYPPPSRG